MGKERDRAGKEDRCLGHAHRLFYCPCAVYPGQPFSNTAAGAFYNRPDDYRSRSFLAGDHPVYLDVYKRQGIHKEIVEILICKKEYGLQISRTRIGV